MKCVRNGHSIVSLQVVFSLINETFSLQPFSLFNFPLKFSEAWSHAESTRHTSMAHEAVAKSMHNAQGGFFEGLFSNITGFFGLFPHVVSV